MNLKLLMLLNNLATIFEKKKEENPTIDIDESAMTDLIKEFTVPITNICLIVIPILGILACLYNGVIWFTKDEEEREQKPLGRSIKKILLLTFVLEALPALLKIFGWG